MTSSEKKRLESHNRRAAYYIGLGKADPVSVIDFLVHVVDDERNRADRAERKLRRLTHAK